MSEPCFLNVPPSSSYSPVRRSGGGGVSERQNSGPDADEGIDWQDFNPSHCFVREGDQSISPEKNLYRFHRPQLQDDRRSHT